mgnify:CR=1 FL=1
MEVNKMKTKHIAMGAIFTSLILVLLVLGYVVPGIELLFMIFLPFLSSYISFEFGLKKSLPFLVASIILSFLLSYINAILYVIPSLVSGVCFGALGKRINKIIDLTFIMSFIEGFLFALSIIVISLLFGLDIQEDIALLINMDSNMLNSNIYLFLFLIGLTQSTMTSVVIIHNYHKLKLRNFEYQTGKIIFIFNIISILSMIAFFNNSQILRLNYGVYFVTLIVQVFSSFTVKVKRNWIFSLIQIFTFLFISIPLLTIIKNELKLFVYSWFLIPLVIKNCFQVFKNNQ